MTTRFGATTRLLGIALLLCVLGALPGFPTARTAHAAPGANPCQRPDNLLRNCSFDGFASHETGGRWIMTPDGWSPFIVAGTPDFRPADDTCPGAGPGCGAPSLWLISDGQPYVAGVYQQVAVAPGAVYQADIGWAAVNVAGMERKLGLDPGGGTDPLAPTVVWGRSEWGLEKWPDLTVTARASEPTMTVFIWVGHGVSHGADSVYFDAPGLWLDPSQPALSPTSLPSLAPTPPPLLATSTPTPTLSPTPAPLPTLTSTPTQTPVPTVAYTPTASPVPPTATATRISVSVAYTGCQAVRGAVVAAEHNPPGEAQPTRGLLVVAIAAAAGAMLAVIGAVVLWKRDRAPEA